MIGPSSLVVVRGCSQGRKVGCRIGWYCGCCHCCSTARSSDGCRAASAPRADGCRRRTTTSYQRRKVGRRQLGGWHQHGLRLCCMHRLTPVLLVESGCLLPRLCDRSRRRHERRKVLVRHGSHRRALRLELSGPSHAQIVGRCRRQGRKLLRRRSQRCRLRLECLGPCHVGRM